MEVKLEKYQLTNFIGLPLRMSKVREGNFTQTSCEERKKVLVVTLIASKNRKSESSNSSIWDKLKFEGSKLSCLGWIKETRR